MTTEFKQNAAACPISTFDKQLKASTSAPKAIPGYLDPTFTSVSRNNATRTYDNMMASHKELGISHPKQDDADQLNSGRNLRPCWNTPDLVRPAIGLKLEHTSTAFMGLESSCTKHDDKLFSTDHRSKHIPLGNRYRRGQ